MFSEKILSHFREPHNAGELTDATHIAEVTNPVCGDVLRLTVRVQGGKIVAARFKAQGCVPSIAAASAMTDMLVGKTLTDAQQIPPADIAMALDGLPQASTHAVELCCDAIAVLRPIG
ncbi:MAG TPA: iron-sulfur cluster assembly scaffold protein [Candidatus Acidoferrales bacterium]|nr:iron-sulfur cluster assembly scaffold protein [Candidatus Acidoferrales bacterium]